MQSDSDIHIERDEPLQNEDTSTTSQLKNVSIPSPTSTVSKPISIAPCPPVTLGVSQPPSIFTDSTTTPTTSIEPPATVNASNVGARASGFTTGHITPPISPLRQNDPDMIYGDDEAPITKGMLKVIHEKLDSLLHYSKASSTDDSSQATVKSLLETLTKEHSANLEKTNKAVDASTTVCNNSTKKVDKIIIDARVFMEKFQSSFELNTAKADEVISSLGCTLKTEKAKLQKVCTGLQTNHAQFNSSISLQISKLQDDLEMERKIMDSLAIKTEKVKVLTVKFKNTEKQVNDLFSEKSSYEKLYRRHYWLAFGYH
ncbi:unnamed protein product [Lactuca saligna]|uniref:Uncharacterized protein n=1 Tax=Lactuca saligna TaxID=75948 RepID=A0AA36ER86_LACSI|nr:unnamed protein product [Lactuca saligna]